MRPDWDIIVVGAGPAGSATALLAARAGARVLLLDRARFPRDKPCSEYLSPAATPLLARLDPSLVADIERAAPGRLYGMRVVGPDGTEAIGRFSAEHPFRSPAPYGFALPRSKLDALLVQAAVRAGAQLEERSAVDELLYDRGAVGGVTTRAVGGARRSVHRARVVVGADGEEAAPRRRQIPCPPADRSPAKKSAPRIALACEVPPPSDAPGAPAGPVPGGGGCAARKTAESAIAATSHAQRSARVLDGRRPASVMLSLLGLSLRPRERSTAPRRPQRRGPSGT